MTGIYFPLVARYATPPTITATTTVAEAILMALRFSRLWPITKAVGARHG